MIRRVRMTIVHLKKRMEGRFRAVDRQLQAFNRRFHTLERRMDRRFDAVDARMDARFGSVDRSIESLGEKLDRIAGILQGKCDHQQDVADEHEKRLTDLERAAGR